MPEDWPENIPWPIMRGDRRSSGRSRSFEVPGDLPEGPAVRFLDTREIGDNGGRPRTINATPIIGPDDLVIVGSVDEHIYGFSPTRQEPLIWPAGHIVDSAGVFEEDGATFYIPSGNFSLIRCRLPEGDETTAPPPETLRLPNQFWSPSSIYWFEGNVVRDGKGRLYAGNDDFYFYCCEPGEGDELRVRWAFPTGFFIWSAAAFSHDEETLYFLSADMRMYALEADTGRCRFEVGLESLGVASPAVGVDGKVYFGCMAGVVYCVDGKTGHLDWTYPTRALVYASVALSPDGQSLYVPSADGVLRCLATGQDVEARLKWTAFLGPPSFCSAAVAPDPEDPDGHLVVVGTGNGEVIAFEPTGRRRWSYDSSPLQSPREEDPQAEDELTADPAFRPSFRYPAINSSIAVGQRYLATAASAGIVLAIPHRGYLESPDEFTVYDAERSDPWFGDLHEPGFAHVSTSGCLSQQLLPRTGDPREPTALLQVGELVGFAALERYDGETRFATLDPDRLPYVEVDGEEVVVVTQKIQDEGLKSGGPEGQVDPLGSVAVLSPDRRMVFVRGGHDWAMAPERRFLVRGTTAAGLPIEARSLVKLRPIAAGDGPGLKVGQCFKVSEMSPFAPFVVMALDQLGIASLSLHLVILGIDGEDVVAYGWADFIAGPDEATRRDLNYLFRGTYRDGRLLLRSDPSYFETTSVPVPIRYLWFSAIVTDQAVQGVSMSLDFDWQRPPGLLRWLSEYVTDWVWKNALVPGRDHPVPLVGQAPGYWRNRLRMHLKWWGSIFTFFTQSVQVSRRWALLSDDDDSVWQGTYRLTEENLEPRPDATDIVASRFLFGLAVRIRVTFEERIHTAPVLGILVRDLVTDEFIDINPVDDLDRVHLVQIHDGGSELRGIFWINGLDRERHALVVMLNGHLDREIPLATI